MRAYHRRHNIYDRNPSGRLVSRLERMIRWFACGAALVTGLVVAQLVLVRGCEWMGKRSLSTQGDIM